MTSVDSVVPDGHRLPWEPEPCDAARAWRNVTAAVSSDRRHPSERDLEPIAVFIAEMLREWADAR